MTDDDEVGASEFSRRLASLERYIAALPSTAIDVKISISCIDRLQRDTCVLAVRALASQISNATSEMRRSSFPWTQISEDCADLGPNSGTKSSRNRGHGTDSRFSFERTQSDPRSSQKNKNMESDPSSSSRKNSESDPSSSSGKKKVEKNLEKNVESDPRSDPRSNEHFQDGNNKNGNGNIRNEHFDKKNDHVDYLRGLRVSKLIIELTCMSINDLRRLMSIR